MFIPRVWLDLFLYALFLLGVFGFECWREFKELKRRPARELGFLPEECETIGPRLAITIIRDGEKQSR